MGIMKADKTLPTNRLIFEIRRDPAAVQRFRADIESVMTAYGLSEEEKAALRAADIQKLGDLGVHPYFLPQVTRLFKGGGYNHNTSDAALLYAEKMGIEARNS